MSIFIAILAGFHESSRIFTVFPPEDISLGLYELFRWVYVRCERGMYVSPVAVSADPRMPAGRRFLPISPSISPTNSP